ncbi:MAG TPA: CoA-binding protein [Syntrophomonas sp.]|nr:CoA-binding protein [Syntrophomonas sp.]HRW12940.1 CoA-binding protein [Syntrophomonas sp.]
MAGSDEVKRKVLNDCKTVAIVGLSDNPQRASHRIGKYLKENGYKIVPVNPALSEVLGEKAYPDMASIPFAVDLVDVFRRQEEVDAVVEEALRINPKAVWLQLGLTCPGDKGRVREAGADLVEDCCVMVEHRRLIG